MNEFICFTKKKIKHFRPKADFKPKNYMKLLRVTKNQKKKKFTSDYMKDYMKNLKPNFSSLVRILMLLPEMEVHRKMRNINCQKTCTKRKKNWQINTIFYWFYNLALREAIPLETFSYQLSKECELLKLFSLLHKLLVQKKLKRDTFLTP